MRLRPKHRHKNSLSNFIAILLFLGIIAITLLSICSSFGKNFYFELASHFKIQYLFITILLFFLLSLTRKKLFFIIAWFCICINTADVIHWYIAQPIVIQQSPNKIRILLVNIPTWPTEAKFSPIKPPLSWLLLIPIDHFLISPEIKVLDIRTGANVGSDHLPLIADLVLDK